MLVPDDDGGSSTVTVALRHLKARHTQPRDLSLEFNRRVQRFTAAGCSREWDPDSAWETGGKLQSALADLWDGTPPADLNDGWEGSP